MSLFGEFHVPAEAFTLQQALADFPETTVEIERVVATDELLTPYFWVAADDFEAFEAVVQDDPTVSDLQELDRFQEAMLYRARWTGLAETIVSAYLEIDATLLEATGQHDRWQLQIRFDTHEQLQAFQRYCTDNDIPFTLTQLHELDNPKTGSQYGLTSKQQTTLQTAWEMGYYVSGDVTLADVADELDISQQSVSERLGRAYHALIENTIIVAPPST